MKPVGYKPRGVEAKKASLVVVTGPAPAPVVNVFPAGIPAVVSSNSLQGDENTWEATAESALPNLLPAAPLVPLTEPSSRAPELGFFEGMPFHLMKIEKLAVDPQMKKAWDIGFAVAMTMTQSSLSSVLETSTDPLTIHNETLAA